MTQNNARNEKSRFVIVDAQGVKNTDTAENQGYDAGKKISGIKCHIALYTQGLPHASEKTLNNKLPQSPQRTQRGIL